MTSTDTRTAPAGPYHLVDERRLDWTQQEDIYQTEVRLVEEQIGTWTVYVPQLPGVMSEGETVEEALHNIREALQGTLESYKADGMKVPWIESIEPRQPNEKAKWVLVHA